MSRHRSAPGVRSLPDVVVIGGGIIGTACAWRLSEEGFRVTVLERSVPGAEASSAAAGIVGPSVEAQHGGPSRELGFKSAALFPGWAKRLYALTGIDVGYRGGGILEVAARGAELPRDQPRDGKPSPARLRPRRLDAKALQRLEPALDPKLAGGVHHPGDGRVDPALLFRAVHIAAVRAGVRFRTGAYVRRVAVFGDRASGVEFDDGSRLAAGHVLLAAGSWTGLIEGAGLPDRAVIPARGQIVELVSPEPVVSRIVFGPGCYLVPRDDGRTLIGSTLEFVGYQKRVTAGAVQRLLAAATQLCPPLAEAELGRAWSNFRPYTEDHLPLLGPGHVAGLTVATGHYRTGILLTPITAEIVVSLIGGRRPPVRLEPFSVERALGRADRKPAKRAARRRPGRDG